MYRAKRPNYQRTSKYRSSLEVQIASQLEKAGVQFGYETIRLKYQRICHYIPDFILPNGVLIEGKGWFTPQDRSKLLLLKKQDPSLDIRLVFSKSTARLNKKSRTTYAEWSTTNGFLWSEKVIPQEWLTL
jgi:hypothetical protein